MAGRYQAYPEYKYTGLKWFGDIPSFWDVSRLKFEAAINMGQSPSSDDCNTDGFGLPFLQGNAEFSKEHPIPKQYCNVARKIAQSGDLLFSVRAPVGAINIADQSYGIGRGLCAISVRHNIDDRYLKWLVPICRTELDSIATGSTFEAVSAEQVENVAIALPSLNEQIIIANFLDHETAKIDTLIDKQQQLIKLLKEKRQAVISHAVTKGLNPAAPMKDSGVEWLGEVPEGWVKIKVKRLFKFAKRQGYEDLTVLSVYREYGVIVKSSRDDNFNKTPENLSTYQLVYEGDLVINKMKAWQGSMGISDFEGITSPDYAVYSPLHSNEDSYLHFWFRAGHMPDVYRNISTGIRPSQWRLDLEEFEHLDVFMPPQEERAAIVERIKEVEERYLKLIGLAETQIILLSERRTALISAAVTGKIDVRNWQPAESKIPMEASA